MSYALYCSQAPGCICENCLYHHSSRCPYGHCYDDLRAIENPYDKAHPDKPARTYWSNWKEDQAYWCRGGSFYQSYECDKYVEYDSSKHIVKECLIANVSVFQDGYISCSLIESVGCEECMKQFEEKMERKEAAEVKNYGLPKGYEDQCCLNRSGMCTLDTADFRDIDRAVGQRGCGFIGVNDRYLMWKYEVPYKEFVCRNCDYYEAGEYSHGVCTNERIEPHAKGVTVDGEKIFMDTKEMYSGAHACKEFIKKGSEKVAKQKYWTKCGRQFEKNSTAVVTGYEINESDPECANCPFQVDVKEGYPPVHKKWECRAGSKEPNHTTEWKGSLEDKNTININSLDNAFMESVLEYCKGHVDLNASYNADHLADCRRTISVSCSSNKKGIAAKKALIEKFFPTVQMALAERLKEDEESGTCANCSADKSKCNAYQAVGKKDPFSHACEDWQQPLNTLVEQDLKEEKNECCCESCAFGIDYGESVEYIKCTENSKRRKDVKKKQPACHNYVPDDVADVEQDGDLDQQLEELLKDEDEEAKEVYLDESQKCISKTESCKYYCSHNEGCTLLLVAKKIIPDMLEQFGQVDCDVWREKSGASKQLETVNKIPENVTESLETVNETANIVSFDYSTVDGETAEFLQEKASTITKINVMSAFATGKELKEAQEKLASHDKTKGVFVKWVRSLGISDDTGYNYINLYTFVSERFGNIEAAQNFFTLPQKLQYAVAKPSASEEAKQATIAGDITTHKQLKELEAKLKAAEDHAQDVINRTQEEVDRIMDEQGQLIDDLKEKDRIIKAREKELDCEANKAMDNIKEIKRLEQQLDQVKRNGDPSKSKELWNRISEYQKEIEEYKQKEKSLNAQIAEKDKQLKDKPIEVPQIIEKIVEVVPEANKYDVQFRVYGSLLAAKSISTEDIKVCSKAEFTRKMSIIEFLENLQDVIPGYLKILNEEFESAEQAAASSVPAHGKCEDCQYVEYGGLSEEDENDGKVYCKVGHNKRLVDKNGCRQFVEF